MKVVNPGKYEITIGGKTQLITVPLGLKLELYKLLTRSQIELARLSGRASMPPEMAEAITAASAKLEEMRAADEPEEEIEAKQNQLDELYTQALQALEESNAQVLAEVTMKKIDLSNTIMLDAICLLISKRDAEGNVTEAVTHKQLMWDEKYSEAQEELTEMLNAVTEYVTSALKKISEIKGKMDSLVEKNPQA